VRQPHVARAEEAQALGPVVVLDGQQLLQLQEATDECLPNDYLVAAVPTSATREMPARSHPH
jgi:hypothetical protein